MKVLLVSDNGVPTGYGRIADEIGVRLFKRAHDVMALSYYYDGLLPAQYEGQRLPYHVGVLVNKPDQVGEIVKVINSMQPDVVVSIQDFPYAVNLFHHPRVDWSTIGRVIVTPVDGAPIEPDWVKTMQMVDAGLTISEFGVKAFAEQGVSVGLCRPGVNLDKFHKLPDEERAALREKLGLAPDAFVLGSMCMNQGRKAVTLSLRGFFEFAKDKPSARYLLDMDEVGPAGWNLPHVIEQQGWDASKIIWRMDAVRAGLTDLNERYNVLDAHTVLAHREGYGLPLAESMACGVATLAMDYSSGTEIVGEGRGCLVKCIDYSVPGTWGGAEDKFPDLDDFVQYLQWLHDNPAEREAMALRGMAWARQQTWDMAADAVISTLERVQTQRQAWAAPQTEAVAA